jgi:hypothetical protein
VVLTSVEPVKLEKPEEIGVGMVSIEATPCISEPEESQEPVAKEVSVAAVGAHASADIGELARARAIAQRLGITHLSDDEYDIPTYMRRQQEREV